MIELIARHRHPLAAVRRAANLAAAEEARFQIALIEAVDLEREPAEQRELARAWLRQLREAAGPRVG